MHAWARPAAEAALCAQEQGDSYFWALHDFMFEHQKEIAPDTLQPKLAAAAKGFDGFDQSRFATCLVERRTAPRVEEDVAFAQKNGINATPTVFINGRQTKVVAPEQLRTIIQQLSTASGSARGDCSDGQCKPAVSSHQ
jgi:protein-disulfide isomerase